MLVVEAQWPSPEWFKKWKETLFLPNIKACISHTYNKAMLFRNQLIEEDGSYSSNQIVNIDEDQVGDIYPVKTVNNPSYNYS
jgi:hypothetical protein